MFFHWNFRWWSKVSKQFVFLVEHFCKTPKNHELVFSDELCMSGLQNYLQSVWSMSIYIYQVSTIHEPQKSAVFLCEFGQLGLANWNGCVLRWATGPLWRFFLMWGFRCKTLRWKVYLSLPHEKSTQEWIMTSIRPPSALGEVVNNRI